MFCISYKGKMLGSTMSRDLAEARLVQLSFCFRNLEMVEVPEKSLTADLHNVQATELENAASIR